MASSSVTHSFAGTNASGLSIRIEESGLVTLTPSGSDAATQQIKVGTSRVDDLQLLPTVRFTGDAPGFATFYTVPAGAAPSVAVDCQQISFVHTATKHLHFSAQMPHTWSPGTRMTPHIHWAPDSTMPNGQGAVFQLHWQIREIALSAVGYPAFTGTLGTNNFRSIVAVGTGLGGSGFDPEDPLPPATTTFTKTSHTHYMTNFEPQTITFGSHYPMSCIATGCLSRVTDANVPGTGITDPARLVDDYAGQIFVIGFDIHIHKDLVCGDGGPTF